MEVMQHNTLIKELTQGREMANQLKNHLTPSSSRETREFLLGKILSSYENAISMLKWELPTCSPPESSPRSEGSDQDFKEQAADKDVFKKRKTMPRWTQQVRVTIGTAPEGPLDDGYSWRKYGQKDILGAHHPRGYYRCSHRHAQGCLATKQVQKSDEDPSIFEVTYRGRHTCIQASYPAPPSAAAGAKEEPVKKEVRYEPQPLPPPQGSEKISNFGSGLKVKTEELDSGEKIFRSFSFSFPESETVEKILEESMIKSSLMGSFSPAFMSPTISESNYFSLSPCHGMGNSVVYSPESELTENISGTTSITNSPMGYYNFSLDPVDFDPNFPFDNPEYFQ